MTWKPSATANDWARWKTAEVAPPMTITRVTVEGDIQGKRAKLEMTEGFIQMQEAAKLSRECIQRMGDALRALRYGAQVNQEQHGLAISWAEVEAICKEGLGE